jgi:cytoskeletal protein RodZ
MHDIGRMLKEGRVARGLEIGDIARKTCISAHWLKAMEEGRFHIIPKVFDKGYLKIYANLLELDSKPLLSRYEQRTGTLNTQARHA